jgi:hypothetical protein
VKLTHLHRLRWLFIGPPREWDIWRPVAVALPFCVGVVCVVVWVVETLYARGE